MHVRAFRALVNRVLRLFAIVRIHLIAPDLLAMTAAFIINYNNRYTHLATIDLFFFHFVTLRRMLLLVRTALIVGMACDLLIRNSVVEESPKNYSNSTFYFIPLKTATTTIIIMWTTIMFAIRLTTRGYAPKFRHSWAESTYVREKSCESFELSKYFWLGSDK